VKIHYIRPVYTNVRLVEFWVESEEDDMLAGLARGEALLGLVRPVCRLAVAGALIRRDLPGSVVVRLRVITLERSL
jgi:hypothetical protein